MNILSSIVRIPFYVLFFSQVISSMDKPEEKIECFGKLRPELQLLIFAHVDNKTSFQGVNQDWSKKGSIRNSTLFTQSFCHIMYVKNKGQENLIGILLCAAYNRNYEGVENILKNTGLLKKVEDRAPFHFIQKIDGKSHILDLAGIAMHSGDHNLMKLLQKYKVSAFTPGQTICKPGVLQMFCVAGDSESVERLMGTHSEGRDANIIEQCVNLSIDFDRGKCLKILLPNALKNWVAVDKSFVERACVNHSLNALEELLQIKSFDINMVRMYLSNDGKLIIRRTLLDDLIENAAKEKQYNEIVERLRAHGAMTAAEFEEANQRQTQKQICCVQ